MRSFVMVASLLILIIGATGCGSSGSANTAHLRGKVTLDGQPVPANAQASITFQPAPGNKGKAITAQVSNGEYDSPNTPKGAVVALFSLNIPTGKMVMSERMGGEVPEIKTVTLSQGQRGGINLDITEDELDHDFALESAR